MNTTNHVSSENKNTAPPKVSVVVSADKMTAYVRVALTNKEQAVTKEQITDALKQKKIEYGILHDEIIKFCNSKNYYNELTAAKGLRPVKGANGSVEFHFKKTMTGMAAEREDGTFDFKKLEIIQNVQKGDVLCTVTLPQDGTDGIDVFKNPVKAQKGDMPLIPSGDKVVLSEDSKFVYANADGGISYKNGVISIEEIYTIKKDVGPSTGNIDFNGSVMVYGNVLEGFSITAKKDITVQGMVEGASLTAEGSILIKGGISGMKKAVVTAIDNVTSTFIENATVKCGKDLYSNVILNADISTGGSIILNGKKGAMIGGTYRAGEKITANVIGNDAHIIQNIMIDPCWYDLENHDSTNQQEDPSQKKQSLLFKRKSLTDGLEKAIVLEQRKNDRLSADERKKMMHDSLEKKSQIKALITQIDKEIELLEQFCSERDLKVICFGEIFPGTRIIIGNAKMKVNQLLQNQKFYLNDGEVSIGAILPNERV